MGISDGRTFVSQITVRADVPCFSTGFLRGARLSFVLRRPMSTGRHARSSYQGGHRKAGRVKPVTAGIMTAAAIGIITVTAAVPAAAASRTADATDHPVVTHAGHLAHLRHVAHLEYLTRLRTRPESVYRPEYKNSSGVPGSFTACVVARESGGNPQVMNSTGHYGLFQFSAGTWAAAGGNPADFGHASVSEQYAVFARAYALWGTSPWRAYDGC